MSVVAGAKAGFGALKTHWLFFAVVIFMLILLAIGYDQKNHTFSDWRQKMSTWPLIGPLFMPAFAVLIGFAAFAASHGSHAVSLLRAVG